MSDDKPEPMAFGDRELSDVILVVEDQEFLVHRSKLAESSDVFERMLCGQFKEAHQDRVEIKDVSATAFKHLMEIVYNGKIEDSEELLPARSHDSHHDTFWAKKIFCSETGMGQLLAVADQYNMTKMALNAIKRDGFKQSIGLRDYSSGIPCVMTHCARCICFYLILLDRKGTIKPNRLFDRFSTAAFARRIARLTDKLIPMDDAKLENIANLLLQVGDYYY